MDSQLQFPRDIAEMPLPYVAFDRADWSEELTESNTVQSGVPPNALIEITLFETSFRSRQSNWKFGLKTARQGGDRLCLSLRVGSASRVLSTKLLFGAQETRFILGERAVYDAL